MLQNANPIACCSFSVTLFLIVIGGCFWSVHAEKVLVYDEQKGIILVDKDEKPGKKVVSEEKAKRPQVDEPIVNEGAPKPVTKDSQTRQPLLTTSNDADIHTNRKKDPPELYFSSGLEYFKNGDYYNAMKNLSFADSVNPQPRYKLWLGKCYRQLNQYEKMLEIMQNLLDSDTKSDVADDALFEIAFYFQSTNDYDKANSLYTQLAEQFPFGTSYSNGEEFREVAREQRRFMRAEMMNLLTLIGYGDDDLSNAFRKFQKGKNLLVTGVGDKETVEAIKKMNEQYMRSEALKAAQEQHAQRYFIWGLAAGGFALVNIVLGIILNGMARSRRRHLESIKLAVADLDIQKS